MAWEHVPFVVTWIPSFVSFHLLNLFGHGRSRGTSANEQVSFGHPPHICRIKCETDVGKVRSLYSCMRIPSGKEGEVAFNLGNLDFFKNISAISPFTLYHPNVALEWNWSNMSYHKGHILPCMNKELKMKARAHCVHGRMRLFVPSSTKKKTTRT